MHDQLMSVEVFESGDMWTKLIVKSVDNDVEVRSDRALVKVEKTPDGLKIHVPSDTAGLYSCYRTELPAELVSILGITDSKADKQVYRILNDEGNSLDDIMFDEDIPAVDWLEKPLVPSQDDVLPDIILPDSSVTVHVCPSPGTKMANATAEEEEDEDSKPRTPPPAYRVGPGMTITPPLTGPRSGSHVSATTALGGISNAARNAIGKMSRNSLITASICWIREAGMFSADIVGLSL
jgi:hypothetical protein